MTPAVEATMPTVEAERAAAPAPARTVLIGVALCALGAVSTLDAQAPPGHRAVGLSTLCAILLPLIPLFAGSFARTQRWRSACLLYGVPTTIALTAATRPAVPLEPIVFAIFLVTALAYIVSAARLLGPAQDLAAQPAVHTTPRHGEPVARRTRRRLRMYRAFQVGAALAFAVPLSAAAISIAGGTPQPLLLVSVSGLLGAIACRAFLVDALERHLQRDPALVGALTRLRRHAHRGRPAPSFYAAALVALLGMALFASRRLLGLATTGTP